MNYALEREKDAVSLGVGLSLDLDPAVDHGHDPIAELLVDERLDRSPVHHDALIS